MSRSLFLISNPGNPADANYAESTEMALDKWENFFRSPIGGFWQSSEITRMDKDQHISVDRLDYMMSLINNPTACEYSIIVFCGHGTSTTDGQDAIQLPIPFAGNNNLYPVYKLIGRDLTPEIQSRLKRTVIIDACRSTFGFTSSAIFEGRQFSEVAKIDGIQCSRYYNYIISQAQPHVELLQSTTRGQYAYGTIDGSIYADTMDKTVRNNLDLWKFNALSDKLGQYCHSIKNIHDDIFAEMQRTGSQIPEYNTYGTRAISFPFAALWLPSTRNIDAGGDVVEVLND